MITFDESVPKTMRKHIKILVPALAIASVALAGCAQPQIKPVATEPDIVSERIASATEKASRALDSISGIEQMRTPLPVEQSYADAPATMQQVITVKWTGPIEQIVQTLAGRAGLSFRTKGRAPGVPITVAVDVYQQPLVQVLQNIGLQAGRRADLAVDGRTG